VSKKKPTVTAMTKRKSAGMRDPTANRSRLRHFLFYLMLNLWPCIRGTGARITYLARDYTELHLRLPLNWRTRNRVGTIFGGSMYAAVDPFYMILLMETLGRDYVVWDKAAEIRFRKPGRTTLKAMFKLTPELLARTRARVELEGETTFDLGVELKDEAGVVHADITKTIYVASADFYRKKLGSRRVEGKA
jgi:hypothetical protein